MIQLQLGYGAGLVSFAFDEARFEVLSRNALDQKPLTDFEIGEAISRPIGSPPLDDLITAGDKVLIVVSDATRATASAQIVNLLVRRLIQWGISASDIAIIFATGIHRRVTAQEKLELLTPFIAQRIKALDHAAYDPSEIISLGTTRRGTPIELNRTLKEFSRVILTGSIGFHYFAGFTGGRKSICPGLASARTIEATHMLALDFESGGRRTGVGTALMAGNAVHEELDEIAALINPGFSINTVVDQAGRATRVFAGGWRESHAVGCSDYLTTHSIEIPARRDLVIVSCGGAPYDINLIQAHKALDMASQACVTGGDIILLAECADGLGRQDFLKWFEVKDSRELEYRLHSQYEVNGQTAWSLLTKAERFRIHLVSDLPVDDVRSMRMRPCKSLDEACKSLGRQSEGYIMPRGAAVLPRVH